MSVRIIYAALIALFVIPFLPYVHADPIITFDNEWLAALFGLFVSASLVLRTVIRRLSIPVVSLIPLGFLLIIGVQALLGMIGYRSQAVLVVLSLGLVILMMVSVASLNNRMAPEQLSQGIAKGLLVAGLFNITVSFVQLLGLTQFFNVWATPSTAGQIYGNLAQRNHFTLLCMLALLSTLYLHRNAVLGAWRTGALLVLFLIGLAISGSRSPWLYLGLAAVMAAILYVRYSTRDNSGLLCLTLGALPLFFLLQKLLSLSALKEVFLVSTANERLLTEGAGTSDVRMDLWRHALEMFIQSKLQGVGYGNFTWENYLKVAEHVDHIPDSSSLYRIHFDNAHNIVLHLLAELGIWGGLVLMLGVGWLFIYTRRLESTESWWLWSVLAVMGIHSLLEYPLWYLHFLLPFTVFLVLLNNGHLNFQMPALSRPVIFVAIMAGVLLLGELYIENTALQRLFLAQSRGAVPARIDLQTAMRSPLLSPYSDRYLSKMLIRLGDPDALPYQLAVNDRFARIWPTSRVMYRRVLLLYLLGREPEAAEELVVAVRVYGRQLKQFRTYLERAEQDFPELTPLRQWVEAAEQKSGSAVTALPIRTGK